MHSRNHSLSLFRAALIVIAVWCISAVTPLAAQQATDPTSAAARSSARERSPSSNRGLPRLTPEFQRFEPRLARGSAAQNSALAVQGGQHTIVISTLVLVLAVIILVLLVT